MSRTPGVNGVRPRRIGWMLGWALPAEWFATFAREAYPDAGHSFFDASSEGLSCLIGSEKLDEIVGYSLGALLLLKQSDQLKHRKVTLLAPIFAYPQEARLGGRVKTTQLKQVNRWLRRDAHAAVRDFYAVAGLNVPSALTKTEPLDELAWGIEQLLNIKVPPVLPPSWRAWIGTDDPLLNSTELVRHVPEVELVSGAGHHPKRLIEAMVSAAGFCEEGAVR